MTKKLVLLGLVISLVLIMAFGCGPSDVVDDVDPPTSDGDMAEEPITVVFSNIAETHTLDPAVAFSSDGFNFVRNVYEGLYEYEPGGSNVRPLLATDYTVSEDGLSYVFQLRNDVIFHDGAPFTAEAVKLSVDRIIDINQGPATLTPNIKEVNIIDTYEVEFVLYELDFYFLGRLPKLPIISPKALEENRTDGDPWARDWFLENAAGTGPYKFNQWFRNERIELIRNEDYWRPWEPGTAYHVILRVDPDVSTAIQLMVQGEVDMIGAVGPDDAMIASTMPGVKLILQPSLELKTLHINTLVEPLNDVRVRRAIEYAFDYAAYAEFFEGFAVTPVGPLPNGLVETDPTLPPFTQDIEKAKELLAEAGYPDGGFTIEFMGLGDQSFQVFAATLLEDSLGKIGIKVESSLLPWPQMPEWMSRGVDGPGISFLNITPETNDPSTILSVIYKSENAADKGGYNWSFYNNPQVDQWIEQVKTLATQEERTEVLHKLQQQLREDCPVIQIAQIELAQPVREEWDCRYETIDNIQVVRFYYARKGMISPHY